jgi:hypothetical protein
MVANRFASLFDEELQGKHCLKITTALYHTKTNKQTHIYKKHIIYLKNIQIGTSIQSLIALNVKDHGFSPSPIKIDFKICIEWFSNKLTTLRETGYNKAINYSL